MSRIFHRPMFRKGGSAGGITSGLRQGYATGGGDLEADPGTEINPEIVATKTEVEEKVPSLSYADFGEIKPPEAPGFDWGSFGLNLMSGPSKGDIFSDIGEAGKEPYSRYRQGRAAYDMNKYQSKLAERQFGLEVYKAMNDDDKLEVQRKMKFYMDQGMTEEEAFNAVIYRKPMHPKEQARLKKEQEGQQLQTELDNIINKYNPDGKGLAINKDQALKVKSFEEWADKNNKRYIQNEAVIDITDFNPDGLQTSEKTGNKILPEGVDNDRYIPNFHYLDVTTGILYKVNDSGTELIVVDMEE